MLDVDGYVAEGSAENIFIVSRGKLYTPDLTACLDGITRRTVVELAAEMGLACIEKRITRRRGVCGRRSFLYRHCRRSSRPSVSSTAASSAPASAADHHADPGAVSGAGCDGKRSSTRSG